jgi:hypothetical protein
MRWDYYDDYGWRHRHWGWWRHHRDWDDDDWDYDYYDYPPYRRRWWY